MITRIENGITIIKADEGRYLVKGDAYSNSDIYLGRADAVENWTEQDNPPPEPTDIDPEAVIEELEGLV